MGEGGYVGLLNGTKYTRKRADQSSYQMHSWNFPESISPGEVRTVYVEFNQGLFKNRKDTSGRCVYTLEGTTGKFEIGVRDEPSNINVKLDNIESPGNANSSTIPLGWSHDGVVYFVLSGQQGSFSTSRPPVDWMQQNLRSLGARPLSQICMPGSHDAGMGEVTWSDRIPKGIIEPVTRTQAFTILGQLHCGSRYFDIRPEISSGQQWTGHYDVKSRLGARGQKISSIIDDINNFTSTNKELIIINLSHAYQTDDQFRDYNQDDWNGLMKELLGIKNRYIHAEGQQDDLSLLRLDHFIGNRKAAVIIVVEAPGQIQLGDFAKQGFYFPRQFNVQNEYSNTDDNVKMIQGQLQKLEQHAQGGDKRLFLLSWTLTQQFSFSGDVGNALTQIASLKSIKEMAYSANKSLMTDLLPRINSRIFPNIVYIDYLDHTNYAALAMAINDRAWS